MPLAVFAVTRGVAQPRRFLFVPASTVRLALGGGSRRRSLCLTSCGSWRLLLIYCTTPWGCCFLCVFTRVCEIVFDGEELSLWTCHCPRVQTRRWTVHRLGGGVFDVVGVKFGGRHAMRSGQLESLQGKLFRNVCVYLCAAACDGADALWSFVKHPRVGCEV